MFTYEVCLEARNANYTMIFLGVNLDVSLYKRL